MKKMFSGGKKKEDVADGRSSSASVESSGSFMGVSADVGAYEKGELKAEVKMPHTPKLGHEAEVAAMEAADKSAKGVPKKMGLGLENLGKAAATIAMKVGDEHKENKGHETKKMSGEIHAAGAVQKPTAVKGGSVTVNGSLKSSGGGASLRLINDDKERPMSPTTRLLSLSRIDEKNQLVSLNDRLAKILSRNRQLEAENTYLNTQLKDANSKLTLITTEMTRSFEGDSEKVRKELDAALKEKLKLEFNMKKMEADFKDLTERLKKRDDEIGDLLGRIKALEAKINGLNTDLKGSEDEKARLMKEKAELAEKVKKLERELANLRKQYEAEAMSKVELENALRSKDGEVQMKMQVHQQQFSELMSSRQDEVSSIGGQLKLEYEAKLADAIRQLRADCELQLAGNRDEQEALYAKKEQGLQGEMARLRASMEGQSGELSSMQMKLSGVESKMQALNGEKLNLENALKELKASWNADKASFSAERMRLEDLIAKMQAERLQLLTDYQELMEIKVKLDNEIATYRALLEGEELRLEELIKAEEDRLEKRMKDNIDSQIITKTETVTKGITVHSTPTKTEVHKYETRF